MVQLGHEAAAHAIWAAAELGKRDQSVLGMQRRRLEQEAAPRPCAASCLNDPCLTHAHHAWPLDAPSNRPTTQQATQPATQQATQPV